MRDELVPDRASWGWIALGLLLLMFALVTFRGLRVDDSFISFRYARQAAAGAGWVFNAGERTEGYSNFLWTVLLAAGAKLGLAPESAAPVLGHTCLALALLVLWRTSHRFENLAGTGWRGVALLLAMSSPTLAYWAGAGLETPLFVLLWLGSRDRLAAAWEGRSTVPAALLLGLLALCRPDGALLVATAAAVWLLSAVGRERRRAGIALAAVTLGLAVYAAWKLDYYGSVLPNTFQAKWVLSRQSVELGARQAGAFVLAHPWAVFAGLGLASRGRRARSAGTEDPRAPVARRLALLLAVDGTAFAAYAIAIGGDPMPYYRFFALLVPGLALLAVLPLARIARAATRGARALGQAAAAVLAVVALFLALTGSSLDSALLAHRVVEIGRVVGAHLRTTLPERSLIAVNAAGAIPYESGLPSLDMLGLVDRHIARSRLADEGGRVRRGHERGDGAYVLARRPAVVVLGNSAGSFEPLFAADRDLLRQPGFAELYVPVEIPFAETAQRLGLPGARTRRVRRPAPVPWAGDRVQSEARLGVLLKSERRSFWAIRETWFLDTTIRLWLRRDLAPKPAPPPAPGDGAPSG